MLPMLVQLSQETGIPLVATNDAHACSRGLPHAAHRSSQIQTNKNG